MRYIAQPVRTGSDTAGNSGVAGAFRADLLYEFSGSDSSIATFGAGLGLASPTLLGQSAHGLLWEPGLLVAMHRLWGHLLLGGSASLRYCRGEYVNEGGREYATAIREWYVVGSFDIGFAL